MAVAFSTDSSEVINRSLGISSPSRTSHESVEALYEIPRCVQWVKKHGFHKVALQFPDALLVDSTEVALKMEKETGAKVYILGDTSYGSCCVDEVAAQHVNADCIVHYGQSCLSPTSHLPVLYVFCCQPVDVEHCVQSFRKLIPDQHARVIIMSDVTYSASINDISSRLSQEYACLVTSSLNIPHSNLDTESSTQKSEQDTDSTSTTQDSLDQDNQVICRFGRTFCLQADTELDSYSIFYIGKESLTLTNLMMGYNRCMFYSYNPDGRNCRKETLNVNKALMKRYYMVEKAKEANVVGIVAGTLGVSDYLTVINNLKEIVKKAGKKSYTFVMGKLNVPKLANFMEIDVFVLVACSENTLIDSSEFYRPVVTPFEMELACNSCREWTGEYITDFRELLPGAPSHVPMSEGTGEDETDVSLISGGMRRVGLREEQTTGSTAVVKRDDVLTVAEVNSGASFLQSLSWQGLEQKLGETDVTTAVEGRTGIAAGYTHEPGAGGDKEGPQA
ncbi:2-(3-amino-3-carboxypropyl)histidine synthase subunit 2-like [Branchiostoma lanceolatum]|uniref:2-(3-amino-3-carboxypropyl)histidine synthase subunit 2-like n=1 Tax=Branchiostoma lanceolatum TaxID=7740 RepID=UPI003452777B